MKKTLSSILAILVVLGILLFPEYLENIISDYFEGSYLVIFAFLVFVVPLSIVFDKVFTKFMNLISQNESYQKELIKSLEKSKNKRKNKTNIFGIKCYSCKQKSLNVTQNSIELGFFARQCSRCKSLNIIKQPAYCVFPPALSILLQKAGVFSSIEEFNLSFKIAICFTLILFVIHFLTPAKPLNKQ